MEQSADVLLACRSLFSLNQRFGEYYRKESVNYKRTDAVSALIRYMALAMSQTTRLVRLCRDINK